MNDIINELINKLQFNDALLEANRIVDEFWRTQVLCDILLNIVKSSPSDTVELIDEIIDSAMKMGKNRNKALMRFCSILLKSGHYYKSVEAADLIGRAEYKSEPLISVADYLSQYGNFDKSEIFDRITFSAGKIRMEDFKIEAYKKIIEAMINLKFFDKAMKLSGKISRKKDEQQALALIAAGYSREVDFDKSIEIAGLITKSEIKSFVLRTIIGDMAKNKITDSALINKLLNIASSIKDGYEKSSSLRDIVVDLVMNKEFEKALEITLKIEHDFWKADSLMYLSVGLSKEGNFDKAMEIVDTIEDHSKKFRALSKISEGLEKAGLKDRLEILRKKFDI